MQKNKKEITLDDLARMMQNGLTELKSEIGTINTEIGTIRNEIGTMRDEMGTMRNEMRTMRAEISSIKEDTEQIKAELNKKVDKIDHNTLIYRVDNLEKKCT